MLQRQIERLGAAKYAGRINPKRAPGAAVNPPVLGFDTEYDSKTAELLSVQLWGPTGGQVFEIARGVHGINKPMLMEMIRTLYGDNKNGQVPADVWLITYFSAAELQHIDTITEAEEHREYAAGFMDCVFYYPSPEEPENAIHIYDLSRWFSHGGLAAVAESYGMKKLAWDRGSVTRASLKNPRFREYALNDARLCYDIFQAMAANFGTLDIDILEARTAPGAAAAVFRSRLYEPIITADTVRRNQALRSYWGGRAEVFRRGRFDHVTEYDLKGAYPSAAISLGRFPRREDWISVTRAGDLSRYRGGLCSVDFKYPASVEYPGLPVPGADDVLIYPLAGRSHCTFDEAILAQEQGARLEIVEAYGYNDGAPDLADFMTWCIDERKKSSGPRASMFKLLANSLIGKLCQKVDKVKLEDIFALAKQIGIDRRTALAMPLCKLNALASTPEDEVKSQLSIGPVWAPEWAALIMGRVRAELAASLAPLGAIYCHTDSIWTPGTQAPRSRWIAWDKKGTGPAVTIRSRLGGLWPPGEAPHIAHHAIWSWPIAEALLYYWTPGGPGQVEYQVKKPARMVTAARKGVNPGVWMPLELTASLAWDHKRILADDGSSSPWPSLAAYNRAQDERRASSSRRGKFTE